MKILSNSDNFKIEIVELDSKNILSIRDRMNINQFGEYMSKLYKKLIDENLEPLGAPLAIYHDDEFDPESSDIEIGIPVREIREYTRDLPGGLFLRSIREGSFDDFSPSFDELLEWIDKEGYRLINPPYEVYVTDPTTFKPEDMVTEVYLPVDRIK